MFAAVLPLALALPSEIPGKESKMLLPASQTSLVTSMSCGTDGNLFEVIRTNVGYTDAKDVCEKLVAVGGRGRVCGVHLHPHVQVGGV